MSDKKQVIHVKNLTIKADNVIIEPIRHKRPVRDPFFGLPERSRREGDVRTDSEKGKHDSH